MNKKKLLQKVIIVFISGHTQNFYGMSFEKNIDKSESTINTDLNLSNESILDIVPQELSEITNLDKATSEVDINTDLNLSKENVLNTMPEVFSEVTGLDKTTSGIALISPLRLVIQGTKINSYPIGSRAKLEQISQNLDGYYKLTADIDLWNVEWSPIGTFEKPFKGGLDGNGFTIKNLKINASTAKYIGLFGYSYYSTFKNVAI